MEEDNTKLPIPGKRNILITSALPCVNNVCHLGDIIGCVLSADVYARYCRLRGYNTIYISGTDDYGTETDNEASEIQALEENCSPKEISDKYHAIHKEIYDWFDISFDKFGRTSTPQHSQVSRAIYDKLWENKLLHEDIMQELYCDRCSKYVRVTGSCPFEGCTNTFARGSRDCKNCGMFSNPNHLKDPKCIVCQTTPRICGDPKLRFIELPYLPDIVNSRSWSQNVLQPAQECIRERYIHRCDAQDHPMFGIPARREKYNDKSFNVWIDVPIGYVSITSCYTSQWEKWWKNPDQVELCHFIQKHNAPFHTLMFPSAQLGTGENWTMAKKIIATEYLYYEGRNFSKSKGVGVFGNDVKDTNIPAEVWRYYLLFNRPELDNKSFQWRHLQLYLNTHLVNNLGKFVYQVLSFIAKPESDKGYGCVIPDAPGANTDYSAKLLGEKVVKLVAEYFKAMEKVRLKDGLQIAMQISSQGKKYLKENGYDKVAIRTAAGLVHLVARLLEPFMPSFSREVFKQLNLPPHFSLSDNRQASTLWKILPPSHRIGTPKPLFTSLNVDEILRLKEKFSGRMDENKRPSDSEPTEQPPLTRPRIVEPATE